MPHAEFEEKSFEAPLNAQLLAGSTHLYAPGQVLESAIGFDSAMWSNNVGFWRLWGGVSGPPGGSFLNAAWWGPTANLLPPLPNYSLNLFLQYKRPALLERSNASEWAQWGQPYFRYGITPHQQAALEKCAQGLGQNGLVVYASPSFWTLDDLFRHTVQGALVAATNFVEASALNGHGVYTYVASGTYGMAFSVPAKIPVLSGSGGIPERISRTPEPPRGSNVFQLADRALSNAVAPLIDLDEFDGRIQGVGAALRDILGERAPGGEGFESVVIPYLRAAFLCGLLGLGWLIGGPRKGG